MNATVTCQLDRHGCPISPTTGEVRGPLPQLLRAWTRAAQVWCPDPAAEGVVEATRQEINLAANCTFPHLVSAEGDTLRWDGCFTPGRWVTLQIEGDRATLRWDSGTGRGSTWIGLALDEAGLARFRRQDIARLAGLISPDWHGRLAARAV
jgi:hypothetical protein